MNEIPEHIRERLMELLAEKLPVDQIAFMMRVDRSVVEEEKARYEQVQLKRPA